MALARFRVGCMALYDAELNIPKEIANNADKVLKHIHKHLHEVNVRNLEWLEDYEPEEAVTLDDIIEINDTEGSVEIRATDIEWDIDEPDINDPDIKLPKIVKLPDEYIFDSGLREKAADWLSDEYGFCVRKFKFKNFSNDELKEEELLLKETILSKGVIEDFLGHPVKIEDILCLTFPDNALTWLDEEMDDAITNMPQDVYCEYVAKYLYSGEDS